LRDSASLVLREATWRNSNREHGANVLIRAGTHAGRLIQLVRSIAIDLRDLGRNVFELARLEAQVAKANALSVAAFSVIALLLVFTGWILLISALVAWIAYNWLALPLALLLVGIAALAAAVLFAMMIKRRAGNLTFKATRQQLGGIIHGD
jgi:uncharacterized membrane protein YqjE